MGYENGTEKGYAYNVTVRVPWASPFFIGTDPPPSIVITAPAFEEYPQFVITAEKEGYNSAEVEIVVIKGVLSVVTDKGVVNEKESFQVTVTDQNEDEIEGSLVYLDVEGEEVGSGTTDSNGVVYLAAPDVEDDSDISIIAFKNGYEAGSRTIRVENVVQEGFFDEFIPILVPILILISVMVFVRFRKKISRSTPEIVVNGSSRNKKFFGEKRKKTSDLETIHDQIDAELDPKLLEKGPRVEEIRIPKQEQQTGDIADEVPTESAVASSPKEGYEWFKGTKDTKHVIDELTEKKDLKKADRWFEGVPDLKTKVDDTVKKKQKKNEKPK